MTKYKYVKRVIIEANKAFPQELELSMGSWNDYWSGSVYDIALNEPILQSSNKTVTIENISLKDWTIRIESAYTDDFQKVVDIVGESAALEVFKVLGL